MVINSVIRLDHTYIGRLMMNESDLKLNCVYNTVHVSVLKILFQCNNTPVPSVAPDGVRKMRGFLVVRFPRPDHLSLGARLSKGYVP